MEILDVIEDDGSSSPFPVVKCNNIYILPGKWIPKIQAFVLLIEYSAYG